MTFLDRIMLFFTASGETPVTFGWVHIVAFLIFIAATFFICRHLYSAEDKYYRRFLLISWIVLFSLELYRQLCFSYEYNDGAPYWDYAWYQFPFQICSGPLYTLLPIALLRDGRVRQALMAYMATFSMFGGIAVMIYPSDIFCSYIGINIQSLIHHGLQAAIGILTLIRLRDRLNYRTLISAMCAFVCALGIAMTLNLSVHAALVANGMDDTFNMFFISPYHPCTLPILSLVRDAIPYPLFLITYIVGFGIVASIMLYGGRFIIETTSKILENIRKRKNGDEAEPDAEE
ncbi:MAG: YwaF family protein [Clostridia bacterium]|nr:YwaF family protein [Clostridia bacterium]